MLWRQHYETRILRDLRCEVIEGYNLNGGQNDQALQVWIAGFGFDGVPLQGVWSRLFQSDFPKDQRIKKVFIFPEIDEEVQQSVQSLAPPSQYDQTLLIADPSGNWSNLIQPNDQPGFAAIVDGKHIHLLMTGPPTEDAWEEFQREWMLRT